MEKIINKFLKKIKKKSIKNIECNLLKINPIKLGLINKHLIPEKSGIYIMCEKNKKNIVYIGESGNLFDRIDKQLRGNFNASNIKKKIANKNKWDKYEAKEYMKKNLFVRFFLVKSNRYKIEHFLIALFNPKYND